MNRKLCLTAVIGLLASFQIYAAENAGNLDVDRIRVGATSTYFGVTPAPAGTCSNWGEEFIFDHTTETGKSYLSMLMAAKISKVKIQVWYEVSTAPGTDETTGCTSTTISTISIIALQ